MPMCVQSQPWFACSGWEGSVARFLSGDDSVSALASVSLGDAL